MLCRLTGGMLMLRNLGLDDNDKAHEHQVAVMDPLLGDQQCKMESLRFQKARCPPFTSTREKTEVADITRPPRLAAIGHAPLSGLHFAHSSRYWQTAS